MANLRGLSENIVNLVLFPFLLYPAPFRLVYCNRTLYVFYNLLRDDRNWGANSIFMCGVGIGIGLGLRRANF